MQWPLTMNKKNSGNYFGLLLKEDQGIAMIIRKNSNLGELVEYEKFSYTNGWENLIQDVDEVLFRLESKYKLHLEETIFFVFSHLIDEKTNQIKNPYQVTIKNLSKHLELKPLGYIDCREAVIKMIHSKEEIALTAILIELDKNDNNIFIFKAGQMVFNRIVSRTDNLIDDLNMVFNELKGKILLPARLILYNSKDLDLEVTKILSYHWPKELFVQLPKVEIIQEKEIVNSLVNIFSQQLNSAPHQEQPISQSITTKTGFIIGDDISTKQSKILLQPKNRLPLMDLSYWRESLSKVWLKITSLKSSWYKILLPIGLLIIGLSILANEYYLHRARLEIFVPTIKIKKTINIATGEKGNVDLLLKPTSKTADISASKQATGEKEIGEAAAGEVTLYNFSKEITFAKGTKIETKGLSFIINDEIKVASASLTSDGSAKLPGKNKVGVSASQIGDQSNLEKGQTFKIEELDQDLYFAKNESNFSGGSKKTIITFSSTDAQDLKNEVLKKAKNQKSTDFNLNEDEKIITQKTLTELTELNYSKEVGDEATEVTLTAKAKTTIFTYKKSELVTIINPELIEELTTGYSFDKTKINYQIDKVEEKKGKINLSISANANAIKTLDKNRAVKVLLGKNKNDIDRILRDNFSITGYNLDLNQPLPIPILNQRLPIFPKNLEIEIDSL